MHDPTILHLQLSESGSFCFPIVCDIRFSSVTSVRVYATGFEWLNFY
uniref:Uncharacterized protein n=1 Tax=Anopheles minimus TaxID=112268 RepID=A0A182WN71_9DIPT